jgi:urease accessory protein
MQRKKEAPAVKLNIQTDFTKMPRAGTYVRAGHVAADVSPFGTAVLAHDERHLRRRVVELSGGEKVLVDLAEPTALEHGDRLLLDDGRQAEILAAAEEVYEIRARNPVHLAELAWHIGNRHLAAAIEPERILVPRDHVIKAMLEGLGASVTDVTEPFNPVRGAYSGHGHHHDHGHHGRGERDKFGRLPGDPHYGHNHA